jgi:hypothetical protein
MRASAVAKPIRLTERVSRAIVDAARAAERRSAVGPTDADTILPAGRRHARHIGRR